MATLQEQRQARGQQIEASRRAAGQAMQDARRALGTAMIERRTGKSQADDLNALIATPSQRKSLATQQPRGSVAPVVGKGSYSAPAASTGGSGIASPLTEKTKVVQDAEGNSKTVPDRDYYAGGFTSSDGLFILPAVSMQRMTDANGAEVQFIFANPQGTVPPEAP